MQLSPQMLSEVITYTKASANAEKDFHKRRVSELYSEDTKIKTRMDNLMNLLLDGEIDKKTHEEKRQQLIERRNDVMREIGAYHNADDEFTKTLISLVELASDAHNKFIGSTVEDKRSLVNLVFANLTLSSEKLDYSLRPPFNTVVNLSENVEWYWLKD